MYIMMVILYFIAAYIALAYHTYARISLSTCHALTSVRDICMHVADASAHTTAAFNIAAYVHEPHTSVSLCVARDISSMFLLHLSI